MGLKFTAKNDEEEETIRQWIGENFDGVCHCYHPDRLILDCNSCLEELARAVANCEIIPKCKNKEIKRLRSTVRQLSDVITRLQKFHREDSNKMVRLYNEIDDKLRRVLAFAYAMDSDDYVTISIEEIKRQLSEILEGYDPEATHEEGN